MTHSNTKMVMCPHSVKESGRFYNWFNKEVKKQKFIWSKGNVGMSCTRGKTFFPKVGVESAQISPRGDGIYIGTSYLQLSELSNSSELEPEDKNQNQIR